MNVVNRHSWIATDSADDDVATATKGAPNDAQSHYITSVSASFAATVSGAALALKQGSTVLATWYVYDHVELAFSSPIKLDPGTVANLVLAASGGGVGAVNLSGFTL